MHDRVLQLIDLGLYVDHCAQVVFHFLQMFHVTGLVVNVVAEEVAYSAHDAKTQQEVQDNFKG